MTFPPQHSTDRWDKIIARRELQYVTQCTDGQAFLHHLWVAVYGHKHDSRSRIPPQDLTRSRDSVETGHGNVGDDNIWRERFGCGNERVAISDSGHHLELRLQHGAEVFNNPRMIIGQNNSREFFRSWLREIVDKSHVSAIRKSTEKWVRKSTGEATEKY